MSYVNPSQIDIVEYLRKAKRIAIVGLSNKPDRTSYQIGEMLQKRGYEIIPVNPILAGQEILGEKVYAKLTDVPGHIDIVNIFRRSHFLAEVAEEFIQTDADIFWAQLGLESNHAAIVLAKANRSKVVMDRCIDIELRHLDDSQ